MASQRKFDLEQRLLDFAMRIIEVVEKLPDSKVCNHLGGQLLRSGTSPALNYGEAQAAESKRDFLHKIGVVLKELRETSIGLQMINRKPLLWDDALLQENRELIAIFAKSVVTTKSNSDR